MNWDANGDSAQRNRVLPETISTGIPDKQNYERKAFPIHGPLWAALRPPEAVDGET